MTTKSKIKKPALGATLLIRDLLETLSAPYKWAYATWIVFLLKYRKTIMGPLWIILAPLIFVMILGGLYGAVLGYSMKVYIPYLGISLIIWSFISGAVLSGPVVFVRNKAILMQGLSSLVEVVLKANLTVLIVLLHQTIIIVAFLIYFQIGVSSHTLLVIPALILMFVHAFWVVVVLGILGARFRDVGEIVEMAMRIAFLATPVLWLVEAAPGRSSIIGAYLYFNPFYHVLEPLRGAILGTPILPVSWVISSALAVIGFGIAMLLYRRFKHVVIFWL